MTSMALTERLVLGMLVWAARAASSASSSGKRSGILALHSRLRSRAESASQTARNAAAADRTADDLYGNGYSTVVSRSNDSCTGGTEFRCVNPSPSRRNACNRPVLQLT